MTRSSLIFATIVSLTLAVPETRLRKCCPAGRVLSIFPEVVCTIPEGDTSELYIVDPEVTDQQNEFPICERPEDVNTVHLSTLNTTDFLQAQKSCIEIMQVISTNESALIAVNCRHSENDRVEEREQPNASPLQLLNIRRCCPKDKVFDVLAKSCVTNVDSPENYTNTHEFLSLLPELPVHFVNVSKGSRHCASGALVTYEIAEEDIQFERGSLWVTLSEDGSRERMPASIDTSCLELTTNSRTSRRLVFRVCRNADYCQEHSCVRKCCQEHRILSHRFSCTNGNSSSTPSAFYDAVSNFTETAWSSTGYGVLFGRKCRDVYFIESHEILGLTKEGYLRESAEMVNLHDSYCLDVFENGSALSLVCFPELERDTPTVKYVITSSLEIISCVFLLLTLLVYIYLPSLQNLHGKTLMCNAASLLVSYLCLTAMPWVTPLSLRDRPDTSGSTLCTVLGYITLFSLLSAFCWLNVMCFDIWRTFGRLRGKCGGEHSQGKRFLLYSMYAWGLALFITLFCVVSDQLPFLPDHVRPYFGVMKCWFTQDTLGELLFFRLPVAIQLTSNVVFFILTSEHCSKVKAEIRKVAADPSDPRSKRFHADKAKLIMNVKLFIVMGITWIAEIASSLLNTYSAYQWKEIVFYWSDAINCLHGVLIFILFVLKPRVYYALKKRLGFGEKKKGSSQGTSTIQDPSRVKKSASNSTLTSSFAVSLVP
ncbi:putative G-protein coupled receptor Mth-like 12 [Halictus rubicundus]|uniref:putative G-protein coupled receptor Mth-like 12 n=1 Tax=Halictus rubicundus TaxID=77578 RepID=UPI004035A3AA